MKVTYNWLRDFVDIKLKSADLAGKLTMAGLEVKSIEQFEGDYVFEIEITSNRPDWLSVIGIAREVAAITRKKMKAVQSLRPGVRGKALRTKALSLKPCAFSIKIEDENDCPFYSGRMIHNVKVGPSPAWLTKRLKAIGLRPVNNIVDITNYILYVTGQPLHAFDMDKLSGGQIIVRRSRAQEEIITIDGVKRKLTPEILVIADHAGPVAIAGIMGGKDTEVTNETQNVILESAYFSGQVTRRASRYLALSSDSSYRFERSVDLSRVVDYSDMATAMIKELAFGIPGNIYKCGRSKLVRRPVILYLDSIKKMIGVEFSSIKVKSILETLGFGIRAHKKNALKVIVPGFRQDVKCEADLLEEICRIYGYENIDTTLAAIKPQEIKEDKLLSLQSTVVQILSGIGFNEVINYSLISSDLLAKVNIDTEKCIKLKNPLSAEQEFLRPNLIAGLLKTLNSNIEAGNKPCFLFEVGDCFEKETCEERTLGIVSDGMSLEELKGLLELLFEKLGVMSYRFIVCDNPIFLSGHCAKLVMGDSTDGGIIGKINKEVIDSFKIEASDISGAQINLGVLKNETRFNAKYKALPKYPPLIRDLSLLADEKLTYERIVGEILSCNQPYLHSVKFKDIYRAPSLGEEKKSITICLEFRSSERTLKDEEVNGAIDIIVERLSKNLNVGIK